MNGGMFQCYIVNFPLGEYLLYSKVYGGKVYYIANIPRENIRGMIGYGWGNVCYIVNFPLGEYLLYSKHSGGRFAMRKIYYATPVLYVTSHIRLTLDIPVLFMLMA